MEPFSSDDEHDLVEVSGALWRRFEQDVAELYTSLAPEASIVWDRRLKGSLSGMTRQVDVVLVGRVADQEMTIAVECKRYARRLGIGAVDEFVGKLLDLNADRGVLCCVAGFTKDAQARAEGTHAPKVKLLVIDPDRTEPPDYSDLLPDCPSEGCWGEVLWQGWFSDSGEQLDAGSCPNCGTWAVRCSECDEVTGFVWDDTDCDGCDARYSLNRDRKHVDVDSLSRRVASVETEFEPAG